MATKKSTSIRRRARRSESVTEAERDEAIRVLLENGQLDSVRRMHFCDADRAIPIVGTPRPKPCPFCGSDANVHVIIRDEVDEVNSSQKHYTAVDVECGVCGTEIPGATTNDDDINSPYDAVLAAARVWNTRKGGAA